MKDLHVLCSYQLAPSSSPRLKQCPTCFVIHFSTSFSDQSPSIHVRVTYNEDNNVIVTVTRSASQLRGSGFCRDKRLFLGYRPMGLSRNSARFKINDEQKQPKLSEFSMGTRANDCIVKRIRLFTRACLM